MSRIDISLYLIMIILVSLSLYLFSLNKIIIAFIILVLFFILLYKYIGIPKKIVLTSSGFEYGNHLVGWEQIDQVLFTVNKGKDYKDTILEVTIKDITHIIHPKYYNNSRDLRMMFEEVCKLRKIKFTVEDRGLY